MNQFIEVLDKRRSHHRVGNELPVSVDIVISLIKDAVRLSPSAFNSQGTRAVILCGGESEALWALTKETLRPLVKANEFAATESKIDRFGGAAGTVLFFEDISVVADLQARFPLYAEDFPDWAEQSNGMAQLSVWLALSAAGLGASLQHYNPLVDQQVADTWNIDKRWKLRGQMPFGAVVGDVVEKAFMDDEKRFQVFG